MDSLYTWYSAIWWTLRDFWWRQWCAPLVNATPNTRAHKMAVFAFSVVFQCALRPKECVTNDAHARWLTSFTRLFLAQCVIFLYLELPVLTWSIFCMVDPYGQKGLVSQSIPWGHLCVWGGNEWTPCVYTDQVCLLFRVDERISQKVHFSCKLCM